MSVCCKFTQSSPVTTEVSEPGCRRGRQSKPNQFLADAMHRCTEATLLPGIGNARKLVSPQITACPYNVSVVCDTETASTMSRLSTSQKLPLHCLVCLPPLQMADVFSSKFAISRLFSADFYSILDKFVCFSSRTANETSTAHHGSFLTNLTIN